MLSAACPSCSAPVRFQHASSVMTVCERCESTVLRSGEDLSLFGKVARFARDLSPIQVGATGRAEKRRFTVAGVLRKGRKAVRWNEWYLVFDDGGTGWLAEGNGEWQLFDAEPVRLARAPRDLQPGARVEVAERKWAVIETATARVLAADGELPFAVQGDQAREYADLRSLDGRLVGTVDFADDPPVLWQGHLTDLVALKLEGLRPITGWSDPTLVEMQGPEIKAVRALRCPNCSAALSLHAPGQAVQIVCAYCGSTLTMKERGDASEAIVAARAEAKLWKPSIELGKRGKLRGVEWELIGAMRRSVTVEGTDYPWTEYFLYNPYRGFAWLVDANGHFNLVRRIGEVPRAIRNGSEISAVYLGNEQFRHFQGGYARVRAVLGEFTWEVAVNDMAETMDFVSPPRMLSLERLSNEITWTLGEYLDPAEVKAAFGHRASPDGIAPNQPNPYAKRGLIALSFLSTAALLAAAIFIGLGVSARADEETLLDIGWNTSPTSSDEVFLSSPFELRGEAENLRIELRTEIGADAVVHLALLNQTDGTARLYPTDEGNDAEVWVRGAPPGQYLLRAEVARPPGALAHQTEPLRAIVVRDPAHYALLVMLVLFAIVAPFFVLVARGNFEAKRWQNSDHAV